MNKLQSIEWPYWLPYPIAVLRTIAVLSIFHGTLFVLEDFVRTPEDLPIVIGLGIAAQIPVMTLLHEIGVYILKVAETFLGPKKFFTDRYKCRRKRSYIAEGLNGVFSCIAGLLIGHWVTDFLFDYSRSSDGLAAKINHIFRIMPYVILFIYQVNCIVEKAMERRKRN